MKLVVLAMALTAALIFYFFLLADRAFLLLRSGDLWPTILGIGILILPILGLWIVVTTWRFGIRVQRLARRLDGEGELPNIDDLPRMPSGRVDRRAADAWFDERQTELIEHKDDWRYWYRLAYAYDIAGDRIRARKTMRHAVELAESDDEKSSSR